MKATLKTDTIIDYILNRIRAGDLPRGSKIPSEYELAGQFGVNKTTANKAVTCLVDRGYLARRRGGAGTVVVKTSDYPVGTIAFLISLQHISFQQNLLVGAQRAAFRRHYRLEYLQPVEAENEGHFWEVIRPSGLHGMLTFGRYLPPDLPFPVMLVDTLPANAGGVQSNCVLTDDREGGRLLARHLLDRGHRHAAFVMGTHIRHSALGRRADGFVETFVAAGVRDAEDRVFTPAPAQSNLTGVLNRIQRTTPAVTAIAFDRDQSAYAAWAHLEKKGVAVPRDVSIVGYGRLGEFVTPHCTMTTIDQHPQELASRGTELLIDLIEGKAVAPVQETLPVELISGNSVAILSNRTHHDRSVS